jgi:hypothetical protein
MSDGIVSGISPNEFSAMLTALWFKKMDKVYAMVAARGGATRCLASIFLGKCSVVLCNEELGSLALANLIVDMGVDINAPMRLRQGYTCTPFQILADRCSVVSPEGLKFVRRILSMNPELFGFCPVSDDMDCIKKADLRYPWYMQGTRNIHVAMISWPDEACSELLDNIKGRDNETMEIMREKIWMKSTKEVGKTVPTTLMGFSCYAGRDATVRRLVLDFGMDVNFKTVDGYTPLHVSMYEIENISDSWICEMLLDLGANPLFRMKDRGSPLSLCEGYLRDPFFSKNPKALKKLRRLIFLMKQYVRFRMSLHMIRIGNGCAESPLAQLGSDLMVHIAKMLAPAGCLMPGDQIAALYCTGKPYFTESFP